MAFDHSNIAVGDWILLQGWNRIDVERVERVTAKLVYAKEGHWRAHQRKRENIIAAFSDEQVARKLAQALDGAGGQRADRVRKAQTDFNERKAAAFAAYDKTAERLIASAMSAFGQDPQGLEAKPASATAKPGRPMTIIAQLARDGAE